jgi:hypothetical protein
MVYFCNWNISPITILSDILRTPYWCTSSLGNSQERQHEIHFLQAFFPKLDELYLLPNFSVTNTKAIIGISRCSNRDYKIEIVIRL